jgi:RHS repeat-associated protein
MLSRESDGVYRSRSGRSASIEMEVAPTATGRTLRMADGTLYEFNAPGRLQAITDVAGNRMTFEVDALGFPFSITDPAGKVYEFKVSGTQGNTRIDRITDPAGRYIEFLYNGSRDLVGYRDQGGNLTQFGYTGSRVNQVTDPRNAVKTIEYDAAGRAVREVLPENAEERYSYTAVGSTVAETRHTDANGNITTYRFNGLGFLTEVIDALGRKTKYDLDPATNLARRMIDPAGRVTQYFHNARGDVIRTIDADNKETKIEYDTRFRKPVRIENALGHVTLMVYDAQGNMKSSTDAENRTSIFTYTSRGKLETITDPLNRVTRLAYDINGNLANMTNHANETMTRIYDSANRVVEIVDNLNRGARLTYDSLDRVTELRDAANGLTKYSYDANGNLLSVTDPNNNPVERNVYDLRNRLKTRTDAKNRSTSYDYDGVGNLIRMTDRKGLVTEYAYDALNRLVRFQDHDGRVTTYAYDLAGNLVRMSDSLSGDILMSYDARDRLTGVVTPQGTVAYAYDALGRRTSRTLSGGDETTYTYDKVNHVKTVTLRGKTASYSYDPADRLAEKVLPNGIKVGYEYDDADRVTSITYRKSDDSVLETAAYTYDQVGQRTSRADGQVPPQDTAFAATYDEANRLTAITINGEVFTLVYDDNGNLLSKSGPITGTTTYIWNARNQLIALSSPAGSATFRYDALDRRIEKMVNGQTTGFIYDGAQVIAELSGSALNSVYHTGLTIDEVLARYGSGGNRTLLSDALMSIIAQTNDDQSVANFYAYSAYGEVATLGPDGDNPLQYTGRENDGTGLYYYRSRYYDPVLKRFISADPIGIAGGTNLYAYVTGNPIGYVDPTGNNRMGVGPGEMLLVELMYLSHHYSIGMLHRISPWVAWGAMWYGIGTLGNRACGGCYGWVGIWAYDGVEYFFPDPTFPPLPPAAQPTPPAPVPPSAPPSATPPSPPPSAQPGTPAPSTPKPPASPSMPPASSPWIWCDWA